MSADTSKHLSHHISKHMLKHNVFSKMYFYACGKKHARSLPKIPAPNPSAATSSKHAHACSAPQAGGASVLTNRLHPCLSSICMLTHTSACVPRSLVVDDAHGMLHRMVYGIFRAVWRTTRRSGFASTARPAPSKYALVCKKLICNN